MPVSALMRRRRHPAEPLSIAPDLGSPPVLLDIDRLYENPDNPRDDFSDDDPDLLALAQSLTTARLINPISVADEEQPLGRYRIICGERRWRAAKLAGWTMIPAVVCRLERAAELQLIADENLQRRNLGPIELARQIAKLIAPESEGGAGMTCVAVAKRYGYCADGTWAVKLVRLLKLPAAWQQRIAVGQVAAQSGKLLAKYLDRPEVMSEVERAYSAGPADWSGTARFERQLFALAARMEEQAESSTAASQPQTVPCSRRAVSSSPAAASPVPEAKLLLSRMPASDPLPAAQDRPAATESEREAVREKLLTAVFDVLDQMTPDELAIVTRYCGRRARGIDGPAARLATLRPTRAVS